LAPYARTQPAEGSADAQYKQSLHYVEMQRISALESARFYKKIVQIKIEVWITFDKE
jgi:hypothetical protein